METHAEDNARVVRGAAPSGGAAQRPTSSPSASGSRRPLVQARAVPGPSSPIEGWATQQQGLASDGWVPGGVVAATRGDGGPAAGAWRAPAATRGDGGDESKRFVVYVDGACARAVAAA